jgi:hypothetical protein
VLRLLALDADSKGFTSVGLPSAAPCSSNTLAVVSAAALLHVQEPPQSQPRPMAGQQHQPQPQPQPQQGTRQAAQPQP